MNSTLGDLVDNEGYLVIIMLFCWGTKLFVLLCVFLIVVGFSYLGVLRMTWRVTAMFSERNIWDGRCNTREISISRCFY